MGGFPVLIVISGVFSAICKEPQIFGTVVCWIIILVVYDLFGPQITTQNGLHHKTVLEDGAIMRGIWVFGLHNPNVAIALKLATTFPHGVVRAKFDFPSIWVVSNKITAYSAIAVIRWT